MPGHIHLPRPPGRVPAHPKESLAALAHDLRGRLGTIRNAAVLMLTLGRDDVTAGKMLTLLERQVGHLSGTADRLAEMARASPPPGVRCRRCRLSDEA